jgi:hypothetical protein
MFALTVAPSESDVQIAPWKLSVPLAARVGAAPGASSAKAIIETTPSHPAMRMIETRLAVCERSTNGSPPVMNDDEPGVR